jgi:hypothetical protein
MSLARNARWILVVALALTACAVGVGTSFGPGTSTPALETEGRAPQPDAGR